MRKLVDDIFGQGGAGGYVATQPVTPAGGTGSAAATAGQPVNMIPDVPQDTSSFPTTTDATDAPAAPASTSLFGRPDSSASGNLALPNIAAPVASSSPLVWIAAAAVGYWLYKSGHWRGLVAGMKDALRELAGGAESVVQEVASEI